MSYRLAIVAPGAWPVSEITPEEFERIEESRGEEDGLKRLVG